MNPNQLLLNTIMLEQRALAERFAEDLKAFLSLSQIKLSFATNRMFTPQ